ncbi:AraC family transcriptional regulator [Amycolatopsis sp. OK19-0408]|uniref:AraC family transcriptional regulator n=1 Tax=Amycolatopsis iheyensis TaxID=2945988 RepID=A0A9X2NLY0_9PSEU|nr:AraC family transcriptional regulator [Amycolatopsis iheyensis]MCR6488732.1 AraC family transcriptional regulator [Amycolatopsis iheyensis]
MSESSERAVLRAVVLMRDHLGDPLTMDDLARSVMFSRFHFTRVFQRVTGLAPSRFLSAMRLHRAKQLLSTTELTIAHICAHVGYSSVGTFSSRFSRRVGMSPTDFRHLATSPRPPSPARLSGRVWTRDDVPLLIYVGLFADCAPHDRPARCTVLDGSGRYELDGVPEGTWRLVVQAVPAGQDRGAGAAAGYVRTLGPITVSRGAEIRTDLELEPACALDPPLHRALVAVREHALSALTVELTGAEPPLATC